MILYLDNDPNDIFFLTRALKKVAYPGVFKGMGTPKELQQICSVHCGSVGAILLDFKLDGHSGLDALRWIKQQPSLEHVQCFMISSGKFGGEIQEALDSGALAYLFKPSGLDGWITIAEAILDSIKASSTVRT